MNRRSMKAVCFALLLLPVFFFQTASGQILTDEEWYRGFKLEEWNSVGIAVLVSDIPFGFSFSRTYPDKFGYYFDLRMNPVRPEVSSNTVGFDARTAREEYGSEFRESEQYWISFNGGVTRTISKKIALYGALGLGIQTEYQRFYDQEDAFLFISNYWVKEDVKVVANVQGGFYYMIWQDAGILGQVGVASYPFGIILGVSYAW